MNAQVLLLGVWVRRPFLPLPPEWDLCSLRWARPISGTWIPSLLGTTAFKALRVKHIMKILDSHCKKTKKQKNKIIRFALPAGLTAGNPVKTSKELSWSNKLVSATYDRTLRKKDTELETNQKPQLRSL